MESKSLEVEPRSSCKIAVNAKGQYSGEVKAYAVSVTDAYIEAVAQAAVLEGLIRKKNGFAPEEEDGKTEN